MGESNVAALEALREVLMSGSLLEHKLRNLVSAGLVSSDVLAEALSRLESFEDDMRSVISGIENK